MFVCGASLVFVAFSLIMAMAIHWQFWVVLVAGAVGSYVANRIETYEDSVSDWEPHINVQQDD